VSARRASKLILAKQQRRKERLNIRGHTSHGCYGYRPAAARHWDHVPAQQLTRSLMLMSLRRQYYQWRWIPSYPCPLKRKYEFTYPYSILIYSLVLIYKIKIFSFDSPIRVAISLSQAWPGRSFSVHVRSNFRKKTVWYDGANPSVRGEVTQFAEDRRCARRCVLATVTPALIRPHFNNKWAIK
jgi:hypothetical protein